MTTFTEPKVKPPTAATPSAAGASAAGPGAGAAGEAGAITPELLASFRREFEAAPAHRLAQNAVTQVTIDDIALNREVIARTDHTFSHLLDDWSVTHQKKSGRCWLFAGLNLFRVGAMKRMNLKDFEFSQNYALFWDKFERSNYFLEAIIATADRDADDRTVAFLLDKPLEDGGQWNMFVNIVKKHGVAPKSAMPETESSSNTQKMNGVLLHKLREGAKTLRDLKANGAPMEALRAAKKQILAVIHRVLCIHLGTPPAKFDWQWNDKDRKFHRDGELTPQQFAQKYIVKPSRFTAESAENAEKKPGLKAQTNQSLSPPSALSASSAVNSDGEWEPLDLDDYVCLVNDPRATSPFGRTFTVEYLGNVVGGDPVIYLNVEVEVMKDIAMRTIMEGEPVWFGCDVGKMMRRDLGIWDERLYDLETLYGSTFELCKADRLLYHQTLMTHAMLFTGVDVVGQLPSPSVRGAGGEGSGAGVGHPATGLGTSVGGRPRRWRVENSWGEENTGRKGFFVMNDSWFDEHMFEIAAKKSMLPANLRAALDQPPIVLPAWDPMGALASRPRP